MDTKQKKQVNIATAIDLVNALNEPDLKIRAATLQAISQRPEKAVTLAQDGGIDLFQELLFLYKKEEAAAVQAACLQTLLCLEDDRRMEVARQEFLATSNSDIILLTARQLAELNAYERIEILSPAVMDSENPTKSRAAANLLAHCKNLGTRVALRVAILTDHDVGVPSLDAESFDDWVNELQGPYPFRTWRILLARDSSSPFKLLAQWVRLPDELRLWALQQAIKEDIMSCEPQIRDILQNGSNHKLLLTALKAWPHLESSDRDEKLLYQLYRHPEPEVRAAAFCAGREVLDWEAMLADESSDRVRASIAARIGICKQAQDCRLLASLLEDKSWRVRAAASDAMVALSPATLPLLHDMIDHPNDLVRAAALQSLRKLGDKRWIESYLSSAS